MNYLIIGVLFILTLLLTHLVRKWTIKKAILDLPNERSSHTIPTPRGGGLAIALVWFCFLVFYGFYLKNIPLKLLIALLCGLPITLVSLIDDIISISPKIRLLVQIVSTTSAVIIIGGIKYFNLGFIILEVPFIFNILVIIGMVWCINLFNFLDGIDGYLSAEVVFICLAIFVLFGNSIFLFLLAITAGFLFWNWQPAKIFMGDVGSTLLGFTIATLALYFQNANQIPLLTWVILTSVFWFDATFTLYRRFRNKEKLSQAHRKHAYQRIVQAGFSHQKTVFYSILINIFLFLLVLMSYKFPKLIIPSFLLSMIVLYLIQIEIDKRKRF